MFTVNRDRLAGLIYLGIVVVGFWSGWDLPRGTLGSIGSGFLPKLALALLGVIGVIKLVTSCFAGAGRVELRVPRSLVLLMIAIASFGFLLERAGLIAAIVAMAVFVDLAGNHSPKGGKRLVFTVAGLLAFSVVVFSHLLGMPLELLPKWN